MRKVAIQELRRVYALAKERLLSERGESDHWTGELSPSALSTATAVSALSLADRAEHAHRVARGLDWLGKTQNPDGGWGDTTRSKSNLSTTCLAIASFEIGGRGGENLLEKARRYVEQAGGYGGVARAYGEDRTFSAPILANLAIAGLVPWEECPELPFHLAALPMGLFKSLGLRVVSYALPALIAVGLANFTKAKSGIGPFNLLKRLAVGPALRRLVEITPESGGYLEAIPITSFVAMSMIAAGRPDHPAVKKNIEFLCAQQNADGSWKIERDLAIWLTTSSVQALGQGDAAARDWLLAQQTRTAHPYTGSAPGAWGWTDSSGSVPDADDTSGALLALALMPSSEEAARAALRGVEWLLDLQNSDGGWPTFCRGWQRLPFDRSCADITAHALRALWAWRASAGDPAKRGTVRRITGAVERGFAYLQKSQAADGSWSPLWFGNENAFHQENKVYGASRVLMAYCDLNRRDDPQAARGWDFLLKAQNGDGSWGGAAGVEGSVEETSLACEALAGFEDDSAAETLEKGLAWLCREIAQDGPSRPAPIGLYFAKLWYYEKLYPIIFSVAALRRALEWKKES